MDQGIPVVQIISRHRSVVEALGQLEEFCVDSAEVEKRNFREDHYSRFRLRGPEFPDVPEVDAKVDKVPDDGECMYESISRQLSKEQIRDLSAKIAGVASSVGGADPKFDTQLRLVARKAHPLRVALVRWLMNVPKLESVEDAMAFLVDVPSNWADLSQYSEKCKALALHLVTVPRKEENLPWGDGGTLNLVSLMLDQKFLVYAQLDFSEKHQCPCGPYRYIEATSNLRSGTVDPIPKLFSFDGKHYNGLIFSGFNPLVSVPADRGAAAPPPPPAPAAAAAAAAGGAAPPRAALRGAQTGLIPGVPAAPARQWHCRACTLANQETHQEPHPACSVCGTPRP